MNSIFSDKVLTIGCHCEPPKGGVAYVLKTYKDFVYKPFHFVANSKGGFLANMWYLLKSLVQCERIYKTQKQIEIVHIHTASYNSFRRSTLFIKQAKRCGKKVVCHIHGGGFRDFRNTCPEYVDKHLRMCDAIVALSETWRKYFAEELGFSNVYVVCNIIEPPQKKQIKRDEKLHFLFLGHICKAKGIFDLIEVIKENYHEYQGKLILDVGGGLFEVQRLLNIIKENKLDDIVHFHGWVSGEQKINILNLVDIFILPSYTEGVPISILEAEAYGMPILSTKVGGIPEIVGDENGILFEPGDKDGIRRAINSLLYDETRRKAMGDASLNKSKYNLPNEVAKQLINVYENITR